MRKNTRENINGFTLTELIVVIAIFAVLTSFCVGIVQTVMTAEMRSGVDSREREALGGAFLAITKDIRSRTGSDLPDFKNITERFLAEDGNLMNADGVLVARGVESVDISITPDGYAHIKVTAVGGRWAETIIHLRN